MAQPNRWPCWVRIPQKLPPHSIVSVNNQQRCQNILFGTPASWTPKTQHCFYGTKSPCQVASRRQEMKQRHQSSLWTVAHEPFPPKHGKPSQVPKTSLAKILLQVNSKLASLPSNEIPSLQLKIIHPLSKEQQYADLFPEHIPNKKNPSTTTIIKPSMPLPSIAKPHVPSQKTYSAAT